MKKAAVLLGLHLAKPVDKPVGYPLLCDLVDEGILKHDPDTDEISISFLDEQMPESEKRLKANRRNGKQNKGKRKKQSQTEPSGLPKEKPVGERIREEKIREEKTSSRARAQDDIDEEELRKAREATAKKLEEPKPEARPPSKLETLCGGEKVEAYLVSLQATKEQCAMKQSWKPHEANYKYAQACELFAMHLAANDDFKSARETLRHFNMWMGKGYEIAMKSELGKKTSKDPRDDRAPDGSQSLKASIAHLESGEYSYDHIFNSWQNLKYQYERYDEPFEKHRGCTWEEFVKAVEPYRPKLRTA